MGCLIYAACSIVISSMLSQVVGSDIRGTAPLCGSPTFLERVFRPWLVCTQTDGWMKRLIQTSCQCVSHLCRLLHCHLFHVVPLAALPKASRVRCMICDN